MKSTPETYREAALEHIKAAQQLWEAEQYVLANYVAGLAVECIFRAYATRLDPQMWDKAHHDLRLWYKDARFDIFVPESQRTSMSVARSELQSNWNNRQRYSSIKLLRAEFKSKQLDRGIRGDFIKERTRRTLSASLEIVTLGVTQWNRFLQR